MKTTFGLTPLRIRWILFTAFVIVGVIGVSWPYLPYKVETIEICPISGTTSRTVTLFGIERSKTIESTTLEAWIRDQDPNFTPEFVPWCQYRTLLFAIKRTCLKSPPVALLDSIQDEIASNVPEDRLQKLLQALRANDRPQQQLIIRDLIKEFQS